MTKRGRNRGRYGGLFPKKCKLFSGGAALLFAKEPAAINVVNDQIARLGSVGDE